MSGVIFVTPAVWNAPISMHMTARYVQRLSIVALVLFALGLTPTSRAEQSMRTQAVKTAKLRISGSASLLPLLTEVARRFEESNPGVKIDVRGGGTAAGLSDLRSGASDIGMMARSLSDTEKDLFAFPIARDGIAVVVNAKNRVTALNNKTLTEVLTGKIDNWKSLGGLDAPVVLALGPEGGGSWETLAQHLKLRYTQVAPHQLITTTEEAIAFVSQKPNGLATGSIGVLERKARAGAPIKLLDYDGFPAASRTVENHLYALARPVVLVTRRAPEGLKKQFIDYALSPALIDLQLKYGFVPYKE